MREQNERRNKLLMGLKQKVVTAEGGIKHGDELLLMIQSGIRETLDDAIDEKLDLDVLPSRKEYIQKLVINAGYCSGFSAVEQARAIPNEQKRKYLTSKIQKAKDKRRFKGRLRLDIQLEKVRNRGHNEEIFRKLIAI
jgi:sugar diacid utilization regulator